LKFLRTSELVFCSVVSSFVLFVTVVNFGDCSRIILCFNPTDNGADEALSSWKMDLWLWNEKKRSLFVIFGT
jgi:hypothetical protein